MSSSRVHGTEFLEHCGDAIASHFAGIETVVFVPYALADHDGYETVVQQAFATHRIKIESIHRASDALAAVNNAQGIFVGGGNTFRLLKTLYDNRLVRPIRAIVSARGIPYMGSSAGTNLACPTIRTSNDMPIVEPPSFEAFGFVPFQINPHFIDADLNSTHKGETREQRLAEYLEENSVPVAGLREGTWLNVDDDRCTLGGDRGMVLFERGLEPQEFSGGADLSFLL